MGEISLVCPGCRAEYRVPEQAIPAEGREVECSNCGRVWLAAPVMAKPAPLDLASLAIPAPPAAPPPSTPTPEPAEPQLSRRLPEAVFNILRDEVEHEKRVRATKTTTPAPAESPATGSDHKSDSKTGTEPDWPATTVIVPGQRSLPPAKVTTATETPRIGPRALSAATFRDELPELADRPKDDGPTDDAARSPTPIRPANSAQIARPNLQPRPNLDISQPPAKLTKGGYRLGFRIALLILVAGLALYSAAPQLEGKGGAGEQLVQLRVQIDKGRLWLQDRVASLTR